MLDTPIQKGNRMADTAQKPAGEGASTSLNQAKMYQLVLFPFNNGATNVYYVLLMNYIAYYAMGWHQRPDDGHDR